MRILESPSSGHSCLEDLCLEMPTPASHVHLRTTLFCCQLLHGAKLKGWEVASHEAARQRQKWHKLEMGGAPSLEGPHCCVATWLRRWASINPWWPGGAMAEQGLEDAQWEPVTCAMGAFVQLLFTVSPVSSFFSTPSSFWVLFTFLGSENTLWHKRWFHIQCSWSMQPWKQLLRYDNISYFVFFWLNWTVERTITMRSTCFSRNILTCQLLSTCVGAQTPIYINIL